MKIGRVMAAGMVAGGVLMAPGTFGGAPAQAAPLNPYAGMQEREEVFEFVQKPAVTKQGGKTIIAFASKAACDATVSVVGPDPSTPSTSSGQAGSGQGGKIVRHLASGVLGKNAPAPFQQGSLRQALEWDGKDDDGKPAPAGCKVKVSLGLGAGFEKIERQHLFGGIRELAVDKDGLLYVAMCTGILSESIQVFDRQGKLVRTLWPPPASTPAEKLGLLVWNKTTKGQQVPVRHRLGGGWGFDIMPRGSEAFFVNARHHTAAATPDGRVVFLSAGTEQGGAKLLFLSAKGDACPPESLVDLGKGFGTTGLAIPPDGKWIYFFGKVPRHAQPGLNHAVLRTPLDKPGTPTVFVGEVDKSGTDNAHFNAPLSVACDANNNVYVADTGNQRIQVFKPDGTHLKTITNAPYESIAVSHKTGAIYGLSKSDKGWPKPMAITKLTSVENPTKAAEIVIGVLRGVEASSEDFVNAKIVADPTSDPPAVWFAGSYRPIYAESLVKVEDQGDKLVQVVDAWTANGLSHGTGEYDRGMDAHQYFITADKRSGQFVPGKVAVGPDGLWYGLSESEFYHHWITRFDPKSNEYVPFAVNGSPVSIGWSVKTGLSHNGKPVMGIKLPAPTGGSHGFQSPFDVALNGDIYSMTTIGPQLHDELTKAGILVKPNPTTHMVQVYAADGTLKSKFAMTGLKDSDGLRVGRHGAVYLVQGVQPNGQALPEGLAAGGRYEVSRWGSLIKLDSAFDKFPLGGMVGAWDAASDKPTHTMRGTKGVHFENALWTYGGVSPVSADYNSCTCLKSSFDLDFYERAFVPAGQTYTINVIDSNGNVAARLGGYGNLNDLAYGKPPAFQIPRSVAVTDENLWVHDCEHRAIVKARLSYAVEETAPVP